MATPAKTRTNGQSQHQKTLKGLRHTDYNKTYAGKVTNYDLLQRRFRITAFTDRGQYDLGPYCSQVVWEEQSANVPTYANQDPPMTGSITLQKPALWQYDTLLPDVFSAMVNPKTKSARYGALGVVVRLDYAIGAPSSAHWEPLWAMRVAPADQNAADQVNLGEGGSWTLNLADDLQFLLMGKKTFQFTKGKKAHQKGWYAHEIVLAVAREFGVPVRTVAKGTAPLDIPVIDTRGVPPLMVIAAAYEGETAKTGKAYIIRWGAPSNEFPTGALEVVPFRRNNALLTFREQITAATLSRSVSANFATWITANALVKQSKGKHRKLTYEARNTEAIKRFGLVHNHVDFGSVSGMAELQVLAKRQLAYDLQPLRAAEITNLGVPTVRRGDAVRINIPEEGYGDTSVSVSQIPASTSSKDARHDKRDKQSAASLTAAMAADPTIFGIPNVDTLSIAQSRNLANNLDAATNVPITVADQGIAFVSSVTHTLTPGTYSMDMTMSFVDILDPIDLQAEIDTNLRAAKLAAQASGAAAGGSVRTASSSIGAMGSYSSQSPSKLVAAAKYLSSLAIPYPSPDTHAGVNLNNTTYNGLYPPGLDCSSSVSWCLFQAGYPLPSGYSATDVPASPAYTTWGAAGEGQQFTLWVCGDVHVFLEFKIGGHMQGNTSGPQGPGAGFRYFAWGYDGAADAAGGSYTPRHWPGN